MEQDAPSSVQLALQRPGTKLVGVCALSLASLDCNLAVIRSAAIVASLHAGMAAVGKPAAAKLDNAAAGPQRASYHLQVPTAAPFGQGTTVQSVLNKHGGDAARGLAPAGSESGRAALAQHSLSQYTLLSGQRGASSGAAVPIAHKPDDLPGDNGALTQSARAGPAPQVCKQSTA